jgi:phage-related holin
VERSRPVAKLAVVRVTQPEDRVLEVGQVIQRNVFFAQVVVEGTSVLCKIDFLGVKMNATLFLLPNSFVDNNLFSLIFLFLFYSLQKNLICLIW